jgi:hypothetical protein
VDGSVIRVIPWRVVGKNLKRVSPQPVFESFGRVFESFFQCPLDTTWIENCTSLINL